MQFSSSERETFFELIKWRRDVRHFRRDPVPEDMVQALKTAMDHAPSVGNARPWRIFSVESQAKRKAVHHIFTEANQAAAQIYDGARASQYHALKLEGIETAPVQLAVFTDTAPAEGHGLGRQSMASTLEQSTAMAVQNLNLAARSFGLGAGMVSVLDHRPWNSFLKFRQAGVSPFICASAGPAPKTTRPCCTATDGRKTGKPSGGAPDLCP